MFPRLARNMLMMYWFVFLPRLQILNICGPDTTVPPMRARKTEDG